MSAPESVYTGALDSPSTTETKVVRLTSSSETSAVLKDRFYLDMFLDPTSLGITGMWAGGCRVGSPNYYMHNISRIGWPTLWKDGFEYVIFWDVGLNTLGKSFTPEEVNAEFNNLTVRARFVSAYYIDGVSHIEYRRWDDSQNTWGAWFPFGNANQPQNIDHFLSWSMDFDNLTLGDRVHGISFRSKHVNNEGIYTDSGIIYVTPTGVRIDFVTPNVTLWMNTSELVPATPPREGYATVLFVDNIMTTEYNPSTSTELYLIDTPNYKKWVVYGYSVPLGYNCVLEVREWTYIPTPIEPGELTYRGFNVSNQLLAEEQAMNNASGNIGTIYLNSNDYTAHKSYSGSSPNWVWGPKADEGYYVNTSGSWPGIRIEKVIYVHSDGYYEEVEPINN